MHRSQMSGPKLVAPNWLPLRGSFYSDSNAAHAPPRRSRLFPENFMRLFFMLAMLSAVLLAPAGSAQSLSIEEWQPISTAPENAAVETAIMASISTPVWPVVETDDDATEGRKAPS